MRGSALGCGGGGTPSRAGGEKGYLCKGTLSLRLRRNGTKAAEIRSLRTGACIGPCRGNPFPPPAQLGVSQSIKCYVERNINNICY